MDELMHSLCCVLKLELLPKPGTTFRTKMLAGCKFFVMKLCLMNKEKVLRSVLAITHVYVVTFDIVCLKI